MVTTALINQLLALPESDREDIVVALQHSLPHPTQEDLDALMATEAEERVAAVARGELETLDGPTVMAALRARYAK